MPCYNSASFMQRGLDSLVDIGYPCEIILINDGSTDDTSRIAHEYAERYDNIIAIDQENTNWGGVVNHGIELARGTYFKVIDSDDRFDRNALMLVLTTLQQTIEVGDEPVAAMVGFVPDSPSGDVEVRFAFDSTRLGGKNMVVFETLPDENGLVATHADLASASQSVSVDTPPKPLIPGNSTPNMGAIPKTGDTHMTPLAILLMLALAGTIATIYTLIQRKTRVGEPVEPKHRRQ
jgi:glycosyltransferase involved in cell wall biosynthesis